MGFRSLALAMTLLLGVGLLAANPPDKNQQKSQKKQGNEQLSQGDKMFLKALIQEDISEINLAHMALRKTSNAQVKEYAQAKILEADPEMKDGAEKIAKANGMNPPMEPNTREKEISKRLQKKSGKLFDNAYMNYEATKQKADEKLVKTELKSTKSSTMKNYLKKEKTPVEQAATSAKQISKKLSTSMQNYKQQATDKYQKP